MAVVPLAMDVPKEYADLAENYSMRQEEGRREERRQEENRREKGVYASPRRLFLTTFFSTFFL
jgi:hypothetical protein